MEETAKTPVSKKRMTETPESSVTRLDVEHFAAATDAPTRGVVFAFHGGCFVGGSVSWDRRQNLALAKCGFDVYQMDFPRTWHVFERWLETQFRDFCHEIVERFTQRLTRQCETRVVFLGRSSGGWLAKVVYDRLCTLFPRCYGLYVCPVLDPVRRAELRPVFSKRTAQFFGSNGEDPAHTPGAVRWQAVAKTASAWNHPWNAEHERLYVVEHDANVPRETYLPEQWSRAVVWTSPRTHQGLTTCATPHLIGDMVSFLTGASVPKRSSGDETLSKTRKRARHNATMAASHPRLVSQALQ